MSSINDVSDDMMSTIESALDMGKFLKVFTTLVGVIKDQQSKIDELGRRNEEQAAVADAAIKSAELAHATIARDRVVREEEGSRPTADAALVTDIDDRLRALDEKLNATLQELHGLGGDNSILDRDEQDVVDVDDYSLSTKSPPATRDYIIHRRPEARVDSVPEAVVEDEEISHIHSEPELGEGDVDSVGFDDASARISGAIPEQEVEHKVEDQPVLPVEEEEDAPPPSVPVPGENHVASVPEPVVTPKSPQLQPEEESLEGSLGADIESAVSDITFLNALPSEPEAAQQAEPEPVTAQAAVVEEEEKDKVIEPEAETPSELPGMDTAVIAAVEEVVQEQEEEEKVPLVVEPSQEVKEEEEENQEPAAKEAAQEANIEPEKEIVKVPEPEVAVQSFEKTPTPTPAAAANQEEKEEDQKQDPISSPVPTPAPTPVQQDIELVEKPAVSAVKVEKPPPIRIQKKNVTMSPELPQRSRSSKEQPSTMLESFSSKVILPAFADVDENGLQVMTNSLKNAEKVWKDALKSHKHKMALSPSSALHHEEEAADCIEDLNHLHPRIVPHYFKYHIDKDLPHDRLAALAQYKRVRTNDHKVMTADNFRYLTPEKRWLLMRRIRQKGRFIQISRNMLEDNRHKYAGKSLKQNVEFIESETRRLFNRVNALREVTKRLNYQQRYLLPLDFHESFDRLVDLLENIDARGGTEAFMAIPPASQILHFEADGSLSPEMAAKVAAAMEPWLKKEIKPVKERLRRVEEDAVSHHQLADILDQASSSPMKSVAEPEPGPEPEPEPEPEPVVEEEEEEEVVLSPSVRVRPASAKRNHLDDEHFRQQLLQFVHECIDKHSTIQRLEGDSVKAAHLMNSIHDDKEKEKEKKQAEALAKAEAAKAKLRQAELTAQEGGGGVLNAAGKEYVDEKLQSLLEQLEAMEMNMTASSTSAKEEISALDFKLKAVEEANRKLLVQDAEMVEARQKDNEALRILQKRLAGISIDNVLDELKVLQTQVNDRPSTSDVSNMMEGISLTFRKHLGENVVGLRSLVDQVYRQIHHKVDREDIKKLISAKLSLMEQDILRREEEMFNMNSTTRCLSCGQLPADPLNAFHNHNGARRSVQQLGPGPLSGTAPGGSHSHLRGSSRPNTTPGPLGTSSAGPGGSSAPGPVGFPMDSSLLTGGVGGGGSVDNLQQPSTTSLHGGPSTASNVSVTLPTPVEHTITVPLLEHHPAAAGSNQPAHYHRPGVQSPDLDDEMSQNSSDQRQQALLLQQQALQQAQAQQLRQMNGVRPDEIYQVLTGAAGLKPLLTHYPPMMPVPNPYADSAAAAGGGSPQQRASTAGSVNKRRTGSNANKIPEPRFRKAKMAAQMKEMVKVPTQSLQQYGYNEKNPFYVMEGQADEFNQLDQTSMHSDATLAPYQGASSRQSQQSAHLQLQLQQQQQQQQQQFRSPKNARTHTSHQQESPVYITTSNPRNLGVSGADPLQKQPSQQQQQMMMQQHHQMFDDAPGQLPGPAMTQMAMSQSQPTVVLPQIISAVSRD